MKKSALSILLLIILVTSSACARMAVKVDIYKPSDGDKLRYPYVKNFLNATVDSQKDEAQVEKLLRDKESEFIKKLDSNHILDEGVIADSNTRNAVWKKVDEAKKGIRQSIKRILNERRETNRRILELAQKTAQHVIDADNKEKAQDAAFPMVDNSEGIGVAVSLDAHCENVEFPCMDQMYRPDYIKLKKVIMIGLIEKRERDLEDGVKSLKKSVSAMAEIPYVILTSYVEDIQRKAAASPFENMYEAFYPREMWLNEQVKTKKNSFWKDVEKASAATPVPEKSKGDRWPIVLKVLGDYRKQYIQEYVNTTVETRNKDVNNFIDSKKASFRNCMMKLINYDSLDKKNPNRLDDEIEPVFTVFDKIKKETQLDSNLEMDTIIRSFDGIEKQLDKKVEVQTFSQDNSTKAEDSLRSQIAERYSWEKIYQTLKPLEVDVKNATIIEVDDAFSELLCKLQQDLSKQTDIAEHTSVVSGADPNLPVIIKDSSDRSNQGVQPYPVHPPYKLDNYNDLLTGDWKEDFNYSKAFSLFGKCEFTIISEDLLDFRVKKVSNDPTVVLNVMAHMAAQVVKTAASIYGVPLSGKDKQAAATGGESGVQGGKDKSAEATTIPLLQVEVADMDNRTSEIDVVKGKTASTLETGIATLEGCNNDDAKFIIEAQKLSSYLNNQLFMVNTKLSYPGTSTDYNEFVNEK